MEKREREVILMKYEVRGDNGEVRKRSYTHEA
jgi:hypothetical protein